MQRIMNLWLSSTINPDIYYSTHEDVKAMMDEIKQGVGYLLALTISSPKKGNWDGRYDVSTYIGKINSARAVVLELVIEIDSELFYDMRDDILAFERVAKSFFAELTSDWEEVSYNVEIELMVPVFNAGLPDQAIAIQN